MTRPAIIINEFDAERIDRLLEQPAYANSPVADALNDELDRAQMLAPEAMPHDVVSMNSKVRFRDLTSGEERVAHRHTWKYWNCCTSRKPQANSIAKFPAA